MKRSMVSVLLLTAACNTADSSSSSDLAVDADSLVVAAEIGGAHDERPEYEFGRVGDLVALDDGRMAVADVMNNVIRVYDANGAHLYSFGRTGEGPGELSGACCLALDAQQRLWVRDGRNARYNVYVLHDDSASYVRQVRMAHGDVNRYAPVSFDRAGNLIDIGSSADAERNTRTFRFHLDSAGTTVRQTMLHKAPQDSTGMKSVERTIPGGVATMFFYQPYGAAELFAHAPTGEFAHALSSRYAIDWRDEAGNLLRHITFDLPQGPPVSERERTTAEEGLDATAKQLEMSRPQLGLHVPSHKPPLRALYFDQDGRLWVELSVADGAARRAHVYATDGSLERTVTWPGDVDLRDAAIRNNAFWGVRQDSLGVSQLVRLQIAGTRD